MAQSHANYVTMSELFESSELLNYIISLRWIMIALASRVDAILMGECLKHSFE